METHLTSNQNLGGEKPCAEETATVPSSANDLRSQLTALRAKADALAVCLSKYQKRYHGAEHAQKDWEVSQAALAAYEQ